MSTFSQTLRKGSFDGTYLESSVNMQLVLSKVDETDTGTRRYVSTSRLFWEDSKLFILNVSYTQTK